MKALLASVAGFLIIAFTAMSGLINVNFQHNLHLPPEIAMSDVITSHKEFRGVAPFYVTHTDIRMKREIKNTDTIKNICKILQEANDGDTITFHLAGFGGEADSMFLIIDNLKTTKAYVTMSVEAPVYSAHAYLALFGNNLVVARFAYLMFHSSSIIDLDCSKVEGFDRGVPNTEHCAAFKTSQLILQQRLLDDAPVLTEKEKMLILQGNDVYLFDNDVNSR